MTFGERIRKLRVEANLTQKDLADKLNVTYQTVSKWETDINEPDLSTLKELAKILNCSVEYLLSDEEEAKEKPIEESNVGEEIKEETKETLEDTSVSETNESMKAIVVCKHCGKELSEEDKIHHIETTSPTGLKEEANICDACFTKSKNKQSQHVKEEKKSKHKNIFVQIASRKDRKPLIWSIILCITAFIATLVICIMNYDSLGIWLTIGLPFIVSYCVISELYCIFSASWISEVFSEVASWSIRFPGIIFSLDWDGLKFLIIMKIIFWVLGAIIGICTFILALIISTILSIFTFIPLLIYNKKHYI